MLNANTPEFTIYALSDVDPSRGALAEAEGDRADRGVRARLLAWLGCRPADPQAADPPEGPDAGPTDPGQAPGGPPSLRGQKKINRPCERAYHFGADQPWPVECPDCGLPPSHHAGLI